MRNAARLSPRRLSAGACLFFGLFLLILAAAPASAQIDPGMRRWVLLTGKWSKGAPDAPAWFDLDNWTLVTKFEGAMPRVAGEPEPMPWMPVAGDFNGDGVDEVMMFNPVTWEVVPAEKGPIAVEGNPEPNPWVPVAGNWDGRGVAIRVFDLRDGALHKLEEGPIRFDRYDPEPDPWRPIAVDLDGKGIDTLVTYRNEDKTANPDWVPVAGDWDGDGVGTLGAFHVPTGQVVAGEPIAQQSFLASAAPALSLDLQLSGGSGGCYTKIQNQHSSVHKIGLGGGACMWIVITTYEEVSCCSLTPYPWGPYGCTTKLGIKQSVSTGYCG